jgi:probable HAF family extracellular repeat protein
MKASITIRLFSSLACASSVGASAATVCPRYSIEDLGTIAGTFNDTAPGSAAMQVNAMGQVAGFSIANDEFRNIHGFVWNSALTDLPPLPTHAHCQALAIDDFGVAVGVSYSLGRLKPRAARWTGSAPELLGDFAPMDISNNGVVVGDSLVAPMYAWANAVKWQDGVLHTLPTLGGRQASAHAVNELGWIVGDSFIAADVSSRACLWMSPTGAAKDLGTLGGLRSAAFDLNENGQIVGYAQVASGNPHAMLVEVSGGGTITALVDLGVIDGDASFAYSINEHGEIVGTSDDRAVLWREGMIEDLNMLVDQPAGWRLTHARSINDAGQIAGQGWHNGLPRAFLLTPIDFAPDVNDDGEVTVADIVQVLAAFNGQCEECAEDIAPPGGDGTVSIADVVFVVVSFGTCP